MMKYFKIIIPLIILFSSCATNHHMVNRNLNSPIEKDLVRLNSDNINELNGIYWNNLDSSRFSLWDKMIIKHAAEDLRIINRVDAFIKFEMLNEKQVEISFILNDTVRITKVCKGDINNGIFILRQQTKMKGIPPLYFELMNQIVGIGVNKRGNLLMDFDRNGIIMIIGIPIPGGYSGWDPKEYIRKLE